MKKSSHIIFYLNYDNHGKVKTDITERSSGMVITITIIVVVIMTIVIAAAFGMAVSKGYSVKHTVDPLPEEQHNETTEKEVTYERTEQK